MRWLVAVSLLSVPARGWQLVFSSDLFGHYVPHDKTSGADCTLDPKQTDSIMPQTTQLNTYDLSLEVQDDNLTEEDVTSRWGDCGIGGVPRLARQLAVLRNVTSAPAAAVTAGNILGTGNWELPVNFSAAVQAATLFDVMGLGPGELIRGGSFLREFLIAVNKSTERKTSIVACNMESSVIGDLVVPSVARNGVLFIGAVDPAVVEGFLAFDSDIQLSDISCVQEEVDRQTASMPIVVVGSAASLNTGILKVTGVAAFVLSGLPDTDKKTVLQGLAPGTADNSVLLVTSGYGETVGTGTFHSSSLVTNTSTALDSTVPDDELRANTIAELQQTVTDFYNSPVTSFFDLTSDKCDSTECTIGDVICDSALIGSLLDGHMTSRPMAVWPGQNLTGNIPKGPLSVGQLYSALPSEQVAIANASGDTVNQLFARAVQNLTVDASASKTFLQVSGVRVTYDLDLPQPHRPEEVMNLCLTCSPQAFVPITADWNYTIVLPVSMLRHPFWSDITSKFTGVYITGYSARDFVTKKAQVTGLLLSPLGNRIGFTHQNPPNPTPTPTPDTSVNTFVTVLITVIVCIVVFGVALLGLRVYSRNKDPFGSTAGFLR